LDKNSIIDHQNGRNIDPVQRFIQPENFIYLFRAIWNFTNLCVYSEFTRSTSSGLRLTHNTMYLSIEVFSKTGR